MYLDYAENQARKGVVMYMKDWEERLNAFLQFNEEAILLDNGSVSHEVAKTLAEAEYDKFQIEQDRLMVSDFDKELMQMYETHKKRR